MVRVPHQEDRGQIALRIMTGQNNNKADIKRFKTKKTADLADVIEALKDVSRPKRTENSIKLAKILSEWFNNKAEWVKDEAAVNSIKKLPYIQYRGIMELLFAHFPETREDIIAAARSGAILVSPDIAIKIGENRLDETILRNIYTDDARDIPRLTKVVPEDLFRAWFDRAAKLLSDLVNTTAPDVFRDVVSTYFDLLPDAYVKSIDAAFPFHGHSKDMISRGILASKKNTEEANKYKQELLLYLAGRKSSMKVHLGSEVNLPVKMKSQKLCHFIEYLGKHILTKGMIIGLPTEDEFKVRTLDILLSRDKEVVSLYERALPHLRELRKKG